MLVIESFEDQESVTKRLKWSGINPAVFTISQKGRSPDENQVLQA